MERSQRSLGSRRRSVNDLLRGKSPSNFSFEGVNEATEGEKSPREEEARGAATLMAGRGQGASRGT